MVVIAVILVVVVDGGEEETDKVNEVVQDAFYIENSKTATQNTV